MRQRLIWCTVWCAWILGALLVITSLDSSPDPPAVYPQVAGSKASSPTECARTLSRSREFGDSPHLLAPLQENTSVFLADTVPDCRTGVIAATGQAADSSPPPGIFQSL
jgi:hypothetical protein